MHRQKWLALLVAALSGARLTSDAYTCRPCPATTSAQRGGRLRGLRCSDERIPDDECPDEALDEEAELVLAPDRLRYCSRVMYDGSGFRGWQDQKGSSRTVQETLRHRLGQRFDMSVRVVGASRTDQGVHARGQAVHFDLPQAVPVDTSRLEFVLNRLLPDDIRVFNVSLAPPGARLWHATSSARGKLYSYRFCVNPFVEPLRRRQTAHAYQPMDMRLLDECLQLFVGTHDFNAFANRIARYTRDYAQYKTIGLVTTRTVHGIDMVDEGGGYYRVDFRLKSALYRMVRNMMGCSFMVASGNMPIEELRRLIDDAPSRLENAARSAPPEGLTLEHVYYDSY